MLNDAQSIKKNRFCQSDVLIATGFLARFIHSLLRNNPFKKCTKLHNNQIVWLQVL